MSKQYKKLQRKLHPKETSDRKKETPIGKDYMLLAVIGFILAVTAFGWEMMNNLSRAMYILLGISMTCTYLKRHARLGEKQMLFVERTGLVTIGFAIALFLITLYYQFTS